MADDAESVVLRLEAQTTQHDNAVRTSGQIVAHSMSDIERSAQRAEGQVRQTAVVIAQGMDNAAYRSRLLGYQISDIGTQLASGANPFLVLAQQAPQVANALEGTAGAAGRLAAFFSGPFGAALLAAGSVLGVLISNLVSADDATKKQAASAKTLEQAIDDLNEALGRQVTSSQRAKFEALAHAQAMLTEEIQARQTTKALLEKAQANLSDAKIRSEDPTLAGEGGFNPGAVAAARFAAEERQLTAKIAAQDIAIEKAGQAIRRANIPLIQQQVAEATDRATQINGRYERSVDSLTRQLEKGKITEADYGRELLRLTKTRDALIEKVKESEKKSRGDGDAKRAEAKAAREAAKAQRELEQTLESIVGKYDPARLAAQKFQEALIDIDRLQAAGLISYVDAVQFKIKAAAEQADAIAQRVTREMEAAFGYKIGSKGDPIEDAKRRVSATQDENIRRFQQEDDIRRRIEESRVRDVAMLYEDLMTGGVKGVWDTFKRMGIQIIAETLARSTLKQLGGLFDRIGTGGGIFGALGKVFGGSSTPARASGGYVGPGQLVRVNEGAPGGRVEGFLAPGTGGTIIPLGQMSARPGGSATIIQNFTLDARGGITTPQLLAQVNNTITQAGTAAALAGGVDGERRVMRRATRRIPG